MRILVDKIPKEPNECPYCKDESNMDMDKYTCKWNGSNRSCYDTSDCPFFVDVVNSNTVQNLITEYEVQGAVDNLRCEIK